jgi:hypothetical protein
MNDKPDFAENLQDFAIKCVRFLPNLFGAGIKTNAEVRSDFKENKKSFVAKLQQSKSQEKFNKSAKGF